MNKFLSIVALTLTIFVADACAPAPTPTLPPPTAPPPTIAPTTAPSPTTTAAPAAATGTPTTEPLPSATPEPAATLAANSNAQEPPPGGILFHDDFSNPESGWIGTDLDSIALDYDNGEYRVVVKTKYIASFSLLQDRQFDDVSIEADARLATGPSNSIFGLLCRATADPDLQSGYQFNITAAGGYGVVKVTGPNSGQEQVLGGANRSSAIHPGIVSNHLRADCSGDRIAMYVNGQKLLEVHDSDYKLGRVGFSFGTNNSPGFDARFDNFVVRQAIP